MFDYDVAARFVLLALLASSSVFGADSNSVATRDLPYTHAQQLVNIGHGRSLNLYCVGKGYPTVIFDSGLGGSNASWDLIQPAIAARTRACSYDRAGLGFSDPSGRPGTSANIVDDLHRLLLAASIKPPYLLVGHSSGGMNMVLYADKYRSGVVGMVLVDPSSDDQSKREWALDKPGAQARWDKFLKDRQKCVTTAAIIGLTKGTDLYKQCMPNPVVHFSAALNAVMLRHSAEAANQKAVLSEMKSVFYASADELRAARRSYGHMPLMVLTHSPFPKGPDETQELRNERTRLWENLHDEIAAKSACGINRTVPNSGHFIQWDQPQAVDDAILEVLTAAVKHHCLKWTSVH